MKKYITVAFVSLLSLGVYAQDNPTNKETDNKISFLERHNDQLNIFFHIQSSFDVVSEQGKETDIVISPILGTLKSRVFC